MDLNVSQFLSPGRKEFIKGTLLLTGAGLFCRILGFFTESICHVPSGQKVWGFII